MASGSSIRQHSSRRFSGGRDHHDLECATVGMGKTRALEEMWDWGAGRRQRGIPAQPGGKWETEEVGRQSGKEEERE